MRPTLEPSYYCWKGQWRLIVQIYKLMGQEVSGQKTPISLESTPVLKSVRLRLGPHCHQIPLTDSSLTMGWLLSEAIRLQTGPETVVGLRTQEGAEVMDVLLQALSRSCAVLADGDGLEGVVAGKRYAEQVACPVSAEHFRLLKVIGKGGYSTVVQGRKRDTGGLFALKIMNKRQILKEDKASQVLTELRILSRVQHPFVISLHHAFQSVPPS